MSARVEASALADPVDTAADDIECAAEVINDLLRLALDQLVSLPDCRAAAAIRGARRFVDDIKAVAQRLHQVGETGGAA